MRKKNKLYTVNRWNQPLFMQDNVFADGGSINISGIDTTGGGISGLGNVLKDSTKINMGQINSMKLPSQGLGLGIGNIAKAAAPAIGGIVGSVGNKLISGGLSSGAGSAISSIGGTVGGALSTVNPLVGGIVSAASGIIGGGVNALFGSKMNKENIAKVENNNAEMRSNAEGVIGASTSDDFLSRASGLSTVGMNFNKKYIGKDGVFSHKVRNKYNALKNQQEAAQNFASHALTTGAENVDKNLDDSVFTNFAAFGGQLNPSDGGAIDYGFMSDYLTMRNNAASAKNKIPTNVFGNLPITPMESFAEGGPIHIKKSHRGLFTEEAKNHGMGVQKFASHVLANKDKYSPEVVKRAVFARNATKFALGGDMQTNGSDFTDGLSMVNAGLSHEQNPYGGVQVGINRDNGSPNLVEEGETIFDDYVFSNRIKPDAQTKARFHVSKNADISFADLSKKLEKESEERPNDAISQAGLKKQMHDLADEQERQKNEQQQREAEEAFNMLPPEQQQAIMQQVAMEQQQAQGQQEQPTEEAENNTQQEPQQQVDEQMMQQQAEQPQMEGNEQQINACGGKMNRFDDGGDLKNTFYKLLSPYVDGGIHTDSDFDKWLLDQKLDRITDWKNILKNKSFMNAVSAQNPALGDAISRGYDFGKYKAPIGKYDFEAFKKDLSKYTKSKIRGNTSGNYAIDKDFNLGKYKTIKELEESPEYKAYTQYIVDTIKRNKGIKFKYKSDEHTYDNIDWKDPNKKMSREDYDILKNALQPQIDGTAVNPNGLNVPIWSNGDKDDYWGFNDNADELFEKYRTDGKGGIFHMTPTALSRDNKTMNLVVDDNGKVETIIGDVPKDWSNVGNYSWADADSDYTYNYYKRPVATDANGTKKEEETEIVPVHKPTWGRYAGLFGPAVGLGMQALGIGKPDYSRMDAAVEAASGTPALANYKPIGDYIGYRPMDIWYEQNRMNANSRATDRAILNNNSTIGTKTAGLLANGYNSQIASGNLYRQALEYNDAQRQKTAEFNRGTNMYNSNAFNQTSATNAQIQNSQRNFKAQMQMDAARQRMAADAAWNQGIYGNVSGLFKGLGDWGKENAQHNMIADMAADGIFGNMNDQNIGKGYITKRVPKKKSNGGRLNRRKRGLTF